MKLIYVVRIKLAIEFFKPAMCYNKFQVHIVNASKVI